jgi:hypothetical protein
VSALRDGRPPHPWVHERQALHSQYATYDDDGERVRPHPQEAAPRRSLPAGHLGIFEAGSQAYHLAMSDLEPNKQVVARFMDEVSDHGDIDLLDELCASDVVNHAARPGLRDGLERSRP